MDRNHIIEAIEAEVARTGLAAATITGRAVGNTRLYQRLKAGGDCTMTIAKAVLSYIDSAKLGSV